MTEKI